MYRDPGKSVGDGGGWIYATTKPDGEIIRAGVLADCVGCHDAKKGSDYLFRHY